MRKLVLLVAALGAAVFAATATAGGPGGETFTPQPGHGIVPTWAGSMATQWMHGAYRATYGYGQLRNHGGPTMTTNTTYAVYWQPSNWSQQFPSGYSTLINQYFGDVAADSGKTTNVYYTETQYSGIQYKSTFATSFVDTDPLPASGCSDSATSVCISDAQLQTEISNFVNAHGLPRNSTTEYFVYTAPGVGSCLGSSGCAFTDYCAYHSAIGSTSSALVYANMPYVENVSGCDAGHHPNSLPGDAALNVTSHEHNESITDEFGNAWYDILGYEDGDKCAWSWGAWLGGSGSTVYNQVINGHHYALQLEYSNADRGCVETGL
jgi:hypothetical protein